MQTNFLSYLISYSKKFAKGEEIFDIILFGSIIKSKEEPRDLDIALIFLERPLSERLNIAQKFKEEIKRTIKNADVKAINLNELFNKKFLARQGIIAEGYSLLHSSPLSERFGFKGYVLFTYNLKNLNHNKKTQFTYSLIGRNTKGMLKLSEATHLGRGAVIIPIEKSAIFEDFLKEWNIEYKQKKILVEE